MDPLSDVLRMVRLDGANFYAVRHSYHHLDRIRTALQR